MLALRRQLSLRPRAKALLKDLKGLNELLLSRSFLVGDAITAADVAAVTSLNDPVNFFLTAAERAAVPNVMRGGFHRRGQPEFVTVAGRRQSLVAATAEQPATNMTGKALTVQRDG